MPAAGTEQSPLSLPWTVGLTGGIGSGKSAVASCLRELGVTVVDSDQLARDVVAPGQPALQQIATHFGSKVLTAEGVLDRAALRAAIFADPEQRRWLEALLHPLIRAEGDRQLAAAVSPYAVLESPLLIEAGLQSRVQRVLVVDVPEDLQLQRAMQRDGASEAQVQAIIQAQVSRAERLQAADDVVLNDRDLATLQQRVAELHQSYLKRCGARP